MIGIYKITNPKGRIYIGQSWNIKKRWNNYKNLYCKYQIKLYNSLKKYGSKNHKFEIIYEFPLDIEQVIVDNYEILYWQQYKDLGIEMLNIKEPGKGGKILEETKQKMSLAKKGIKWSEESIQKRIEKIKGKKQSKDICKIKSDASPNKKSIIQYDLEDNFIKKWSSIAEASKELKLDNGAIVSCLKGRQKTAFKYKWKYNNE